MATRIEAAIAAKRQKVAVELVETFPDYKKFNQEVVLGYHSWYLRRDRLKLILKRAAITLQNGAITTQTELARQYLLEKFGGKRPHVKKAHLPELTRYRRAPIACLTHGEVGDCVYLDMVSAYWQVLLACGWDVLYIPQTAISARSDVNDFPYQHLKLARNSLVSIAHPADMVVWTGRELVMRANGGGQFLNSPLWAVVMDVLNGIASDMVTEAGAVWVNTDGYIIPLSRFDDAFGVADRWGVKLAIKASGRTILFGVNAYICGERATKTVKRYVSLDPVLHVDNTHVDWLRHRFAWLARYQQRKRDRGEA